MSASGLNTRFGAAGRQKPNTITSALNSASYTVASGAPAPFAGDVIKANNRVINLVLVGINYKFGPWW